MYIPNLEQCVYPLLVAKCLAVSTIQYTYIPHGRYYLFEHLGLGMVLFCGLQQAFQCHFSVVGFNQAKTQLMVAGHLS